VLTGDFNGDGRTDIALTGVAGWVSVPVAFSNGDGTWRVTNQKTSRLWRLGGGAQRQGADRRLQWRWPYGHRSDGRCWLGQRSDGVNFILKLDNSAKSRPRILPFSRPNVFAARVGEQVALRVSAKGLLLREGSLVNFDEIKFQLNIATH
jgi:hypothetical protein